MVLTETISPCHFSPTIHSYMGVKHQVTYHSVEWMSTDMMLLSTHAWHMFTNTMLLSIHAHSDAHRYGVTLIAHTMNVQWNGAATWDHQLRPYICCCHQGPPFTAMNNTLSMEWTSTEMSHQHYLHIQSVPCLTMMQWMSLIQCQHQESPYSAIMSHQHYLHTLKASQWCSQCPWYSAGIRDYRPEPWLPKQTAILRFLRSECCSISWVQRPIYFVSEDGPSSSLWWVEPSLLDPAL